MAWFEITTDHVNLGGVGQYKVRFFSLLFITLLPRQHVGAGGVADQCLVYPQ